LSKGFELSSSSSQNEFSSKGFKTCERYAHLLQSVMLQYKKVEDPVVFVKEDYTVLQNILLGALEFLTQVTEHSEGSLPVPKQLYLVCVNRIQEIPFTLDGSSKVKSRMEAMVDSLVKHLLGQNSSLECLASKEIKDILLSVGSSAMFRDVCLLRLAWHLHGFAACLKLVAKGRFYSCTVFE